MKRFKIKTLSALFVLIAAVTPCLAQDNADKKSDTLSIDELVNMQFDEDQLRKNLDNTKVEAASKSKENIGTAPGLMTVIGKQEISAFGGNSLTDVLNRVVGMYVAGSYYFPNNLPTVRGDLQTHTASHVLILIDGRPLRESMYGGLDFPVLASYPLDAIERLEIIRGPGSVLYGTNAFTGVINIVTKQEQKDFSQVTLKTGSFGTTGVSFINAVSKKDFHFSTTINYFNQKGWDFNATDQKGVNKTQQYGQDNLGIGISAMYKNLSVRSFLGKSDREVMGDVPTWNADGTFNAVNAYRNFVDVGYKMNHSAKQYSTINLTLNSFSQKSNRDLRPAQYYSSDGLLEFTHFIKPNPKLNIIVGALGSLITGQANGTNATTSVPYFIVPSYSDVRLASYVQADYRLSTAVKLIAGGQVNKVPGQSLDFVPRIGTIINITPELGFKGLYGAAYKTGAASELYSNVPNTLYGNANLLPEKVTTTDLQIFYQKSTYQFTVSAFQSDQTNTVIRKPFSQLPDVTQQGTNPGANYYLNLGTLQMKGLEAEAKIFLVQDLQITATYAYQESRNNKDQTNTTTVPNDMLKIGISYVFAKGLTLGVFNSYFSKPGDVINSQTDLTIAQQRVLANPVPGDFNLMTLNLNTDFKKLFNLTNTPAIILNVYADNLLDQQYYYPEFSRRVINSLPAYSGRAFYVSLGVKF
ncbi:MAG: TonB-dependent receptor plug domain-containing protein [Cyclobacteriaceae bacterium]